MLKEKYPDNCLRYDRVKWQAIYVFDLNNLILNGVQLCIVMSLFLLFVHGIEALGTKYY